MLLKRPDVESSPADYGRPVNPRKSEIAGLKAESKGFVHDLSTGEDEGEISLKLQG